MKEHRLKLVSREARYDISPYQLYLDSLAPGGRKGMVSILNTACAAMGWRKSASQYPWHQLTYTEANKARSVMLEQGYAVSSVNLALAGLRSIAKVAFNMELMTAERLMRIQAVKPVKGNTLSKGRSLSIKEIKAVIKYCNKIGGVKGKRDKALFLLGCGAGLRCAELASLRVCDYEKTTGLLKVLNCKGRKQRQNYLSATVRKALQQWINELKDNSSYLFVAITKGAQIGHQRISSNGIGYICETICKGAGIHKFTPHTMRKTFITSLLNDGVDLNLVRQLAGHSNIATTTKHYDFRDKSALKLASRSINL